MTELTETLAKPIGPLPLGGWIVAGAGGIAVAVFIRRRGLSNELSDAQAQAASDAADNLSINGEGGSTDTQPGAGNLFQPGIFGDGTDDEVEKPTTNAEWRQRAVSVLAVNGYEGSRADRVLSDYIAGKQISTEDSALVSAAIRLIGGTPDPIKLVPTTPVTQPGSGVKTYATNYQWYLAAVRYLRTRNVTFALATSALKKYLNMTSGTLSSRETAAVGMAVTHLGPPPVIPKPSPVSTIKATTNTTTSNRRDVGTG